MAFGDNFDGVVDHFDSGLIVDRVARHRHAGGPSFCVCHSVFRQVLVIQVRKDREVNDSQRFIATGGRLPYDEVFTDTRVITMLQALNTNQTVSRSDGSSTLSATNAVADVGGLWRVDHPNDLQLDARR
jgi:hypothetical protein